MTSDKYLFKVSNVDNLENYDMQIKKSHLLFYRCITLIRDKLQNVFLLVLVCCFERDLLLPKKIRAALRSSYFLYAKKGCFYNSNNPFVFLTPSALSESLAFSASLSSISTIFSIPFLPSITGAPIHRSLKPYSPSNKTEQGKIFF